MDKFFLSLDEKLVAGKTTFHLKTVSNQKPVASRISKMIARTKGDNACKNNYLCFKLLNFKMEGNVNYRQALTKAMAMCSQSERCRFDIVAKLRQWELPEEEIAEALNYLVKEHFLDEERFVRFYVSDKLRFNQWGKVKMLYMLRQKQIPETIIRDALGQIDDELYVKTLHKLLSAKVKSVKGASDYERKGKLAVFAQSHGFEAELAFRMAGKLIGNEE